MISFLRRADDDGCTVVVTNFTPVVRPGYRIGVPEAGRYREVMNSDRAEFGGSGVTNGELCAEQQPWHSQPFSVVLTVPPLATVYIKKEVTMEE